MKIGLVCPVFNEPELIGPFCRHWRQRVDDAVVMVSLSSYYGNEQADTLTEEIASSYFKTTLGTWRLDDSQRNEGLFYLRDCDWIITADSDEFMTQKEWLKLWEFLSKTDADVVTVNQRPYFKDWEHVITDNRWSPVFAVRPHVRFTHIRSVDSKNVGHADVTMHHLSWCRPKNIEKKIRTYAHASNFKKEWVEYYNNWEGGEVKFPDCTLQTEIDPLPQEIAILLY